MDAGLALVVEGAAAGVVVERVLCFVFCSSIPLAFFLFFSFLWSWSLGLTKWDSTSLVCRQGRYMVGRVKYLGSNLHIYTYIEASLLLYETFTITAEFSSAKTPPFHYHYSHTLFLPISSSNIQYTALPTQHHTKRSTYTYTYIYIYKSVLLEEKTRYPSIPNITHPYLISHIPHPTPSQTQQCVTPPPSPSP